MWALGTFQFEAIEPNSHDTTECPPNQNTRARERKGQFRAHQQVINKRCPFCPALFKVRSALESHLASKHADQFAKGEINIDALPDAEGGGGILGGDLGEPPQPPPALPPLAPIPPTSLAPPFISGRNLKSILTTFSR